MKDKRLELKEKLRLTKKICEEECNLLYLEEDIDLTYDHYSPEVGTVYLRENSKTVNRVTHASVKHIADRIKKEVGARWYLGLIVSRPELFAWYTGEDDDDEDDVF